MGLVDLDNFPSGGYGYCNWGNLLGGGQINNSPIPGFEVSPSFSFSRLTGAPFKNLASGVAMVTIGAQQDDLDVFLSESKGTLTRLFLPSQVTTSGGNSFYFPSAPENAQLFRYFHFSNSIPDSEGVALNQNTKKAIILVHGWNRTSKDDQFDGAFAELHQELRFMLQGANYGPDWNRDWRLAKYDWHLDSDTGGAILGTDEYGFANATQAAEIGHRHGQHLGEMLQVVSPNLEKIHFIAHSAGTWVVRAATKYLLMNRPNVRVQVTLLDAFVPTALPVSVNSFLSASKVNEVAQFSGNERLYLLDNYFTRRSVNLPPTPDFFGTENTFGWRGKDIAGTCVDEILGSYVDHDGPITFYADTIKAVHATAGTYPDTLIRSGIEVKQNGWRKSLFWNEPFLSPPTPALSKAQALQLGETVTLTASATTRSNFVFGTQAALSYQWQKLSGAGWQNVTSGSGGNTASYTLASVTASDAGSYRVLVSNETGPVYSEPVTVNVNGTTPRPTITSVTPRTLSAAPSTVSNPITITGTGFAGNSKLRYTRLDDNFTYSDKAALFDGPTQLRDSVSVGLTQREWTVAVVNDGVASLPYKFYVVAGPKQLVGLSIQGPATIAENGSGQFTATALFSDGSQETSVAATWSGTGINASSGVLTAGSVAANTPVTVTANFTRDGITKSSSANVVIVDVGSSGGTQTQELIVNGDFSLGGSSWDPSLNFYADNRFMTARSPGGYAYLSNPNGSAGNDLYGEAGQFVTNPASATQITLSYWYRITTEEAGTAVRDTMTLRIISQSGGVETIDTRANTHANVAYEQRSFDITRFKGQRIFIGFVGQTDSGQATTFRIDDVSVQATIPPPVTLLSLAINGPSSVTEGTTANSYTATAIYSDGTTNVVSTATWAVTPGHGSISSVFPGFVQFSPALVGEVVATISASFSAGGVTVNASKAVTILKAAVPRTFRYVAIYGPQSVNENSSDSFTAKAIFSDGTEESAPTVWRKIGEAVSIDSATGRLTAAEVSADTTVVIAADVTAGGVTLTGSQDVNILNSFVAPPPVGAAITSHPQASQTASVGGSVSFTVIATGTPTPNYQWRKNSVNIPNANGPTYTLNNVTLGDAGTYDVIVSNTGNSVTSNPAVLTVNQTGTGFPLPMPVRPTSFPLTAPTIQCMVIAWGRNVDGETNVPAGLSGVVAISGGQYHSLALKSDGTVVGWGWNVVGQTTTPVGLNGVVAVAAGGVHSVALKSDGTVTAWGSSANGQSAVPPNLNAIVAIAAGDAHSLVLKNDGSVVAWGRNAEGQTTIPSGLNDVVAIASGGNHNLALKSNGTVVAWGSDGSGESTVPPGLSGVVAISAGFIHSLALKNDGTIQVWGSNSDGRSVVPAGLSSVVAIAAGSRHNLALKSDGSVAAWGSNYDGETTLSGDLSAVVSVEAGGYFSLLLRRSSPLILRDIAAPPQNQTMIRSQGFTLNTAVLLSPSLNYVIQVSPRLSTNQIDWVDLTNFPGSSTTFQFLDTAATNAPQRFYRLKYPLLPP